MKDRQVYEFLNVLFVNAINHKNTDSTDMKRCKDYIERYINNLECKKQFLNNSIVNCIYNLSVFSLVVFLCWYFNSSWGCLALVLLWCHFDKS